MAVKVHMTTRTLPGSGRQSRCQRTNLHRCRFYIRGANGGDEVLVVCRCALGRGRCPVMTCPVISWISVESFGYAENAGRK